MANEKRKHAQNVENNSWDGTTKQRSYYKVNSQSDYREKSKRTGDKQLWSHSVKKGSRNCTINRQIVTVENDQNKNFVHLQQIFSNS